MEHIAGGIHIQIAHAVVLNDYDSLVPVSVIGDTLVIPHNFADLVFIGTRLIIGNGTEGDTSVGCAADLSIGRHGSAGGNCLQLKGKAIGDDAHCGIVGTGSQIRQGLDSGQSILCVICCYGLSGVGIDKVDTQIGQIRCVIHSSRRTGNRNLGYRYLLYLKLIAAGFLCYGNRHQILRAVIFDTHIVSAGNFCNQIIMGSRLCISDGFKDDIAEHTVGFYVGIAAGLIRNKVMIRLFDHYKAEFAVLQLPVESIVDLITQYLIRFQRQLGTVDLISVNKVSSHIPHASGRVGNCHMGIDLFHTLDLQLAVQILIGNDHLEVMVSGIVGHTGSRADGLADPEVMITDGIKGQTVDVQGKSLLVHRICRIRFCKVCIAVVQRIRNSRTVQFNRIPAAIATVQLGIPLRQGKGEAEITCPFNRNIRCICDLLRSGNGNVRTGRSDRHFIRGITVLQGHAVAGFDHGVSLAAINNRISGGQAGGDFVDLILGAHRNIGDPDDLAILDADLELAVSIGILLAGADAHFFIGIGGIVRIGQGDHRVECCQFICDGGGTVVVLHLLGNGEEAVLDIVVGEHHGSQGIGSHSAAGGGAACAHAIDQHITDGKAANLCFHDAVSSTVGNIGDGNGLARFQLHNQLTAVGRRHAIHADTAVCIAGKGNGELEFGTCGSGNAVGQLLGQLYARCGSIGQPAVVAQVHQLIVMSAGITGNRRVHDLVADHVIGFRGVALIVPIACGRTGLIQVMGVGIGVHGALWNHPTCAIHLSACQRVTYDLGIVGMDIGGILAIAVLATCCDIIVVHIVICVAVAGGGFCVGVGFIFPAGAVINQNRRILCKVVMLVFGAGLKICVGQIIGGRIINGAGIVAPCVGVQIVAAVAGGSAEILHGQLIDQILIHTHFVQQADRLCLGSGDLGAVRLDGIVLIQLHLDLVGNHRQQGCRDPEGDHLRIGFKILADLHGDIHHVRCDAGSVGRTQHAIACIAVHCAGRGSGIGRAPGSHIVALGIAVPANEVAEALLNTIFSGGVAELLIIPSFTDEFPCPLFCGNGLPLIVHDIGNAETLDNRPHEFIAQCSRLILGTQPDAMGQCRLHIGCHLPRDLTVVQFFQLINVLIGSPEDIRHIPAGMQIITHQNTLHAFHFHAGTDGIREGHIAGVIGAVIIGTGGVVTGGETDLVDDILERVIQLRGSIRGEILIHIFGIQCSGRLGNRCIVSTVAAAQAHGHGAIGTQCVIGIPQIGNIGMGAAGGIQHGRRNLLIVRVINIVDTEADGVHVSVDAVLLRQLRLDIGRGKLRHKAVTNVARAAAAVGVVVRNSSKLVGGVSRRAVTHQHDGGGAVGGICGIPEVILPCLPQAALNVGAAAASDRILRVEVISAELDHAVFLSGRVGIFSLLRRLVVVAAASAVTAAAVAGRSLLNAGSDLITAAGVDEVMLHTVAVHIDTGVVIQRQ